MIKLATLGRDFTYAELVLELYGNIICGDWETNRLPQVLGMEKKYSSVIQHMTFPPAPSDCK